MRLAGAVSEGSGSINEDGFGTIGPKDNVTAAWVFDGVTGINGRNYLPAGSDAAWLVARAHAHLLALAAEDRPLLDILAALVAGLIVDWDAASQGLSLPADYDPPAACLILAKSYPNGWTMLRLGDSCLLARYAKNGRGICAIAPDNDFDRWLSGEARKRRAAGVLDASALLAEFRPQLIAGRGRRNKPGGYSILEASAASLDFAEVTDLGEPSEILLCTDGYYRAVDHYGLHDDRSLIEASLRDVRDVLGTIRAVEASDPACEKYLRFKPADDATAVMLTV